MYMRQDPYGCPSLFWLCSILPETPEKMHLTSRRLQGTMAKCEMEIGTGQHETYKMGFVSRWTVCFTSTRRCDLEVFSKLYNHLMSSPFLLPSSAGRHRWCVTVFLGCVGTASALHPTKLFMTLVGSEDLKMFRYRYSRMMKHWVLGIRIWMVVWDSASHWTPFKLQCKTLLSLWKEP